MKMIAKYFFSFVLIMIIWINPSKAISSTVNNNYDSPHKKITIITSCKKNRDIFSCNYSYKKFGESKLIPIVKNTREMSLSWINDIAILTISFGSYDTTTFLVDIDRGIFTVDDVLSIEENGHCLVSADNQGVYFKKLFYKGNELVISSNDPTYDFMGTATLLSIVRGKFLSNGDFLMSYLNANGKEKQKVIKKPCGDIKV